MNPFFSILSALYIFTIFFWADSSAVSQIGEFNPFSLLHIPLYGILTALLLLAFASRVKSNLRFRYALVAVVAIAVGILDEYHQSFIPTREASVIDVLLDTAGVSLVMIWAKKFPPPLWLGLFKKFKN